MYPAGRTLPRPDIRHTNWDRERLETLEFIYILGHLYWRQRNLTVCLSSIVTTLSDGLSNLPNSKNKFRLARFASMMICILIDVHF